MPAKSNIEEYLGEQELKYLLTYGLFPKISTT